MDVRELSRLLALPVPLGVLPATGARVPGVVVRILPALVGACLCVIAYRQPGFIGLGLLLCVLAAVAPAPLPAWVLIVFLAASRLPGHASLDWRFFVLLFGLHLLDVLAGIALVAPVRGWVQLAVFARPLRRFVVMQLAVQAFAAVVLWLLAPGPDGDRRWTLGVFGVVGAIALVVVTILLAAPLLRDRPGASRDR